MFRDSRGIVHTVSSADPLEDLPAGAASALQGALLGPVHGDLGGALERCDAVVELLEAWQDAFFGSLPDDIDLAEERGWAAKVGMSLDEIEAQYSEQDSEQDADLPAGDEHLAGDSGLDMDEDDVPPILSEELVSMLERELLLLPVRTRLEALVAAADLVGTWSELLGDEEKLLGHLLLRHGGGTVPLGHEALADRHAAVHAEHGPGHST